MAIYELPSHLTKGGDYSMVCPPAAATLWHAFSTLFGMLDLDFSETVYIFSIWYSAAERSMVYLANFLPGQAKIVILKSHRNQLAGAEPIPMMSSNSSSLCSKHMSHLNLDSSPCKKTCTGLHHSGSSVRHSAHWKRKREMKNPSVNMKFFSCIYFADPPVFHLLMFSIFSKNSLMAWAFALTFLNATCQTFPHFPTIYGTMIWAGIKWDEAE